MLSLTQYYSRSPFFLSEKSTNKTQQPCMHTTYIRIPHISNSGSSGINSHNFQWKLAFMPSTACINKFWEAAHDAYLPEKLCTHFKNRLNFWQKLETSKKNKFRHINGKRTHSDDKIRRFYAWWERGGKDKRGRLCWRVLCFECVVRTLICR